MKDIPHPHLLKFGPKIWKFLVICTFPKFICCQKTQLGSLGVKLQGILQNKTIQIKGKSK